VVCSCAPGTCLLPGLAAAPQTFACSTAWCSLTRALGPYGQGGGVSDVSLDEKKIWASFGSGGRLAYYLAPRSVPASTWNDGVCAVALTLQRQHFAHLHTTGPTANVSRVGLTPRVWADFLVGRIQGWFYVHLFFLSNVLLLFAALSARLDAWTARDPRRTMAWVDSSTSRITPQALAHTLIPDARRFSSGRRPDGLV